MSVIADTTTVQRSPALSASQALLDNAANRRMCAGTYLDGEFRDALLREVYNDRNRRVAPSYGFNVVLVLRHAWRAWWLEMVQHVLVVVVLVIACLNMVLDSIIAIGALVVWHVLGVLVSWGKDMANFYTGKSDIRVNTQLLARGKLLRNALFGSLVVIAAAVAIAASKSNRQNASGEPWLMRAGIVNAVRILVVIAVIVSVCTAVRMIVLRHLQGVDAGLRRRDGRRMHVISAQQHHPITVYSGFKPFVGSGENVRSWSFAQRLIHEKTVNTELDREYIPPPFTAANLLDRLRKMILRLRDDEDSETRLPGLKVKDRVFVEGTHAASFHDALIAGPDSVEVDKAIEKAIADPSDVARHYLASTVDSWGGEVVTSIFVHVSLQGRTLYLEFATYALLPTRAEYHVIDEASGTGIRATGIAIAAELARLPELTLAVLRLMRVPTQLWAALCPKKDRTGKITSKASSPRRRFFSPIRLTDIGAEDSAREMAAVESDESYFQYQDILQHSKVIERQLIATVGDFLKELKVDTTEFWQRATAILNNGVINAGSGTINVVNSAIGEQATVTTTTTTEQPQPAEGTAA